MKTLAKVTNTSNVKVLNLTKPLDKVKYFDRSYILQQLEGIENKQHKLLFTFLWYTGVRISEALAVRKRDIEFSNYFITIRWLKKRRYETRKIPMHPDLRNILEYSADRLKLDEQVFPITRQRADQLAKRYGFGSCHKLRHSFAVNWLFCGGDIYLLSKMLGHSSIKVTEVYLQIVPVDIGRELTRIKFDADLHV